jgi:hypothetical protein
MVATATALLTLGAGAATAHEERAVGRYSVVVGFGEEPAYAGTRNSVQVRVSDPAGKPVRDLGGTLDAMLMAGGQERKLPLEPAFGDDWGTPGDYRAWFVPSVPGRYAVHLAGTIKGQRIDQVFTSGPGTFDDVQDPARASFPATRTASAGELAQRLDRELPRLAASTQGALAASQAAERRARAEAGQARLLALGGIALGLLGVVLAILAVVRANRLARPATSVPRHLDRARSLT